TWLEGLEVEPATAKNYRYILEQYVIPFKFDRRRLGDFPVREIRRRHVKALVAHNRRQFSKNTVRVMRCVLSSLLTDAMDDELIEVNPALQLNDRKKRGQIGPDAEIRPMDEAQFRAFIDACESELVYGKE